MHSRDEQEVKDDDLEPVLDDILALIGPRAGDPATSDGQGEGGIGGVLRVRQPAFVRVNGPDGECEEHIDAFDMEVAEPRPNLEGPVDEQEHVADQEPLHLVPSVVFRSGEDGTAKHWRSESAVSTYFATSASSSRMARVMASAAFTSR